MKKIVVILGIVLIILSIFTLVIKLGSLQEKTQDILYVGGTGAGNYTSIQEAVNASKQGDTIYVYSGVYYENQINIFQDNISLVGEKKETTIINGQWNNKQCPEVISIYANNTNLQGFTIINGYYGVFIAGGYSNKIENNNISGNGFGETLCSGAPAGICLVNAHNNTITNNNITNNSNCNLLLSESSYNTIFGNLISDSFYGLLIYPEWYKIPTGKITSENNIVYNNNITKNIFGIELVGSNNNTFYNNNISFNEEIGFKIINSSMDNNVSLSSNDNLIYHNNFFNNNKNAFDECANFWYNKSSGNYWDDYNKIDSDNNSVGDIPYNILGGNNQDKFPLIVAHSGEDETKLNVKQESLYLMLILGTVVAVIFLLPIAYYWKKKYFT